MSEDQRQLATVTYQDAGREVSQNFSTMYSNLTLASGLLTALLGVLGAGELFKGAGGTTGTQPPHMIEGIPALSPISVMVLVLVFPLLFRFFVRTMLAYNNLLRYNKIRAAAWKFLQGQSQWTEFSSTYCLYELKWKSPQTIRQSMWSILKYGFMWLFAVFVVAIGWGFATTTGGWKFRLIAGLALILGAGWEIGSLIKARTFYFSLPTREDRKECESMRPASSDTANSEELSVKPAALRGGGKHLALVVLVAALDVVFAAVGGAIFLAAAAGVIAMFRWVTAG
ncbi:hypothetical protein [Mycobacterium sp. E787]|uniref:hypothetical protein n=1 Tax=Mycobacterium sp. E787 TaxID=1834150 RepID=UPI0007FE9843|nr:hypothetical protein [Mycobacterium sp. E787]OBI50369.1 hypothetical protein A5705_11675 [Mycobacterium sp. E787]